MVVTQDLLNHTPVEMAQLLMVPLVAVEVEQVLLDQMELAH